MKIETTGGTVRGSREEQDGYSAIVYRGIPYAKAGRFQKPEAITWDGVLACNSFGKAAILTNEDVPVEEMSEECLNLNIYCPDTEEKNLPVLVDIHGGAFQNGCNRFRTPHRVLKDKKFIYVAMNYRVGAFGYLYLGEELGKEYEFTGNLGTLDQTAALKWVQDNIKQFGGDPSKVTLMGTSAGGKSVGTLMYLQEAAQCFSQAILSSGAAQSIRSKETAARFTKRFLNGRAAAELLTMSAEEIRKMQIELCAIDSSTCFFGPVADGVVLPEDSWNQIGEKFYWSGKAIVGSCLHELTGYREAENFLEHVPELCENLFGENKKIAFETFRKNQGTMEAEDLWVKILSDYMYRMYSYQIADYLTEHGSEVYVYSMNLMPAYHCMDQFLGFECMEQDNPVGDIIWEAYTSFVTDGRPHVNGETVWEKTGTIEKKQMVWDRICRLEDYKTETAAFADFPKGVYL